MKKVLYPIILGIISGALSTSLTADDVFYSLRDFVSSDSYGPAPALEYFLIDIIDWIKPIAPGLMFGIISSWYFSRTEEMFRKSPWKIIGWIVSSSVIYFLAYLIAFGLKTLFLDLPLGAAMFVAGGVGAILLGRVFRKFVPSCSDKLLLSLVLWGAFSASLLPPDTSCWDCEPVPHPLLFMVWQAGVMLLLVLSQRKQAEPEFIENLV